MKTPESQLRAARAYYWRNREYVIARNRCYQKQNPVSPGFSWLWRNNRHLAWQLIRRSRLRKRQARIESGELVFQENGVSEPKPPEGGLLRSRRF